MFGKILMFGKIYSHFYRLMEVIQLGRLYEGSNDNNNNIYRHSQCFNGEYIFELNLSSDSINTVPLTVNIHQYKVISFDLFSRVFKQILIKNYKKLYAKAFSFDFDHAGL